MWGQFFQVFTFLWPVILLCFPHLIRPRVLPTLCAYVLAQMDFSRDGLWEIDSTYYGIMPPPFLTPEESFCTFAVKQISLTSRMMDVVFLSLYSRRSQFVYAPAINFFLEMSGTDKFQFTQLEKFQLLSPQTHCLPTSSSTSGAEKTRQLHAK